MSTDLTCPISQDRLEDPIIVPCCGHAFSRAWLVTHLARSTDCPLCRTDISDFDPATAVVCRTITSLMDAQQQPEPAAQQPIPSQDPWKATLTTLPGKNIGKLEIRHDSKVYDNLFIIAVDTSGSMHTEPIQQVRCALGCIATAAYSNPHLKTFIVPYSDRVTSYPIDTSQNRAVYDRKFRALEADGGTSFNQAFQEITKIASNHKDNDDIACMTILFLTDGKDNVMKKHQQAAFIAKVKANLQVWDKDYVLHTVGFGEKHDAPFLDELRKIGSQEGAYRYANPSDNTDALSKKINSITHVVSETTVSKKVTITGTNLDIKHETNGSYWVVVPETIDPITFRVGEQEITIEPEISESADLWPLWYSILIDEIVTELLSLTGPASAQTLATDSDGLDRELRLELLTRRSNSILCRLSPDDRNYDRLVSLKGTIEKLKQGGQVDTLKLMDAKFEGQFATDRKVPAVPAMPAVPAFQRIELPQPIKRHVPVSVVERPLIKGFRRTITSPRYPFIRGSSSKNASEVEHIVLQVAFGSTANVCKLIDETDLGLYNGSTLLHYAASVGRDRIVERILAKGTYDINAKNSGGYTALDLAVLYGFQKTCDLLTNHGMKVSHDPKLLLNTCLERGDIQMASKLVKDYRITVTDEMMNNAPNAVSLQFLQGHCKSSFPIETAILKGAVDIVTEKLPETEAIMWDDIVDVLTQTTQDHLDTIDLIMRSGKMRSKAVLPLLLAAEKGNLAVVEILLKYLKDNINQRNDKGTTALWIACCNKHIDVVCELIKNGADVNIANKKGNSCLIPACQRGHMDIVTVLLKSNIDICNRNKDGDDAVLICCRTGQTKILEMLLKKFDPDMLANILDRYALIDGHNPLLAAAEVDKVECIKMVVRYGADLEWKTNQDGQTIQGATALHLACHYGRLGAAQVLCELGANINSRTTYGGYTPLHVAIKSGNTALVGYLLSNNQSALGIADDCGRLPEYYANMQGREEIKEIFFTDRLSDLLKRVVVGGSSGCVDVIRKYATSYGCFDHSDFIDKKMYKGMTPLSLSLVHGNTELTGALRELGAKSIPDDYGITPDFWEALLYQGSASDLASEQLNRIKAIAGASLQNEMLMNLTERPSMIEADKLSIDFGERMNSGFNSKPQRAALTKIQNASKPPILGFLDKLQKSNMFPEGKQYLNYLLWEARLHIIKLVASGETDLDPVYMMALYLYTSSRMIFDKINSLATDVWNPIVVCMYQAVKLLPSIECEVYRGVDHRFDMGIYTIGSTLTWNTFGVASKDWTNSSELIEAKRGIIFIIHHTNGKDVSRYSDSPVNGEVVFAPGTRFVIENLYRADIIALGQPNIRQSTYSASESDLIKAHNGEACIIVELTEL